MSAYIVILIGLSSAIVLIGVYGYLDYMSGRHVSDMYTGLRDMMESIKERLRILEDTVEAMKRSEKEVAEIVNGASSTIFNGRSSAIANGVSNTITNKVSNMEMPKETKLEIPKCKTAPETKLEKVIITEPIDVVAEPMALERNNEA